MKKCQNNRLVHPHEVLNIYHKTRMHSSRMRTVLCSGRQGTCLPEGCLPGGVSARGVSAMEGCLPSACWDTPTPMNRMTDGCENITLPELLLRMVITLVSVVIAVETRPPQKLEMKQKVSMMGINGMFH